MYVEDSLTNRRGEKLATHTWKPAGAPRCLVFLSHGFSEHLGLYQEVAASLNSYGYLVFGHDHVGHGKSDGKRVYIENVDDYCDDVIQHCVHVKEKYPDLKLYIVGHSMGGMVTIRAALMQKEMFHGMVLNGPLVVPGPQIFGMDLRATPIRTFISRAVLSFLSMFIPESSGSITKDMSVRLSLNYGTPFLVIHGSDDILCNPVGSQLLYRRSRTDDKELKIYDGSRHQLFLEIPDVRQEALRDVGDWIQSRI